MEYDSWGKTYAELTPEEREIVDKRMKELRAQEAEFTEDDPELNTTYGGAEFRYGEDAYSDPSLGGRQR